MREAFFAAIEKARQFEGATAPNPPVGAVALDASGQVLSVQAHERAGTGHAEAKVLADLASQGRLHLAATLLITLEPCNHHGRTPPCTEAILAASHLKKVVYGSPDPNPRVKGGGGERLREAGIDAQLSADAEIRAACDALIAPFSQWSRTGMPWVVVKTAHRWGVAPESTLASMRPEAGTKTFTSEASLRYAHGLRKRADAILTGSGTVLADQPEFTVRRIADHPLVAEGHKRRKLVVLDRRGRVGADWLNASSQRGFEVWVRSDLRAALEELGRAGVMEVLVEAGPELSSGILQSSLWHRHVLIIQSEPPAGTDRIEVRCSLESSKS